MDTQKERTVDWVQRRFGAPKEVLNVTTIHSCQYVPSQMIGDFSTTVDTIGTTKNGNALWTDEF